MNLKFPLITLLLFWITSNYAQKQKNIPLTSNSIEAIEAYKKGKVLEGLLKTNEAEQEYQRALQLDSTFAMAHIALAMVKDDYDIRKASVAKAMTYINKVSEGEKLWILGRNNFYGTQDGTPEYDCFKNLINLFPEDENANYLFGFVHVHHGKKEPDSAIHYYKKALKLNPNVSKYYNELAYAYMLKRDFDKAENIIKKYIDFLPKHESPRDTYADMLMRDHRYKESIIAYDNVLKINPNAPWGIMGKAANLSLIRRYKDARTVLDGLDTIPLSDYEYRHKWRSRVCTYLMEGQLDSAIVVLEQQKLESALKVNTREPLFHQYMALARMTRLHFENNQPDEGLIRYNEWVDFVKNNITRQRTIENVLVLQDHYLAYHHFLKGDIQKAITLLNAMKNRSEDSQLLFAKILLKEEKTNEAIKILEDLDQTNPYYVMWLSKAYFKNGNLNSSQRKLKEVSSLIELNNIDYALAMSINNI